MRVQLQQGENKNVVAGLIRVGGKDWEVKYECSGFWPRQSVVPFVDIALVPAMEQGGGELVVEGPVPESHLRHWETLQSIYARWERGFGKASLQVDDVREEPKSNERGPRVAAFFSGGCDSFHTFLECRDEITDLIFLHGFDIALEKKELRQSVAERLRKIAKEYDKNFVEITTNARDVLLAHVPWSLGHGPFLGGIVDLLGDDFRKVYIPSSHTYEHLFPWGSHVLTDPLWGGDSLQVVHHGAGCSRLEKIELIATDDCAVANTRVCWVNPDGEYNCGRCEKCMRTMLGFKLAGIPENRWPFEEAYSVKRLAKQKISNASGLSFYDELMEAAKERGQDWEEEVNAIKSILLRCRIRKAKNHLRRFRRKLGFK